MGLLIFHLVATVFNNITAQPSFSSIKLFWTNPPTYTNRRYPYYHLLFIRNEGEGGRGGRGREDEGKRKRRRYFDLIVDIHKY
jgi:hypothetical protein